MKNSKLHPGSGIYLALVMLFLYLPIIMLIVLSFNGTNSTSVIQGFSTKWYVELFKDSATINALTNTLILAVTSAITATVIGTLAAVGIDKMKKGVVKSSVMTVTNIPMMNPEIVTGVSMMLLFVFIGSILGASGVLGFWTLFIAHVTFSLPYVIRIAKQAAQFRVTVFGAGGVPKAFLNRDIKAAPTAVLCTFPP